MVSNKKSQNVSKSGNRGFYLPSKKGLGKSKQCKKLRVLALRHTTTGMLSRNKLPLPETPCSANGKKKGAKNGRKRGASKRTSFTVPLELPDSLEDVEPQDSTGYLESPNFLKELLDSSEHLEPSGSIQHQSTHFVDFLEVPSLTPNNGIVGYRLFEFLIRPHSVTSFFRNVWEKQPMLCTGMPPFMFGDLLTSNMIDIALKKSHFEYGEHVDVTNYIDGRRETYNNHGRAIASQLWAAYYKGCSIRLLNPQIFFPSVATVCTSLQDLFGTFVGANVYLTPQNSQGFAPHFDDIEAFIIQLEGEKEWKLYLPRSAGEELPLFSSPDFLQEDLGEPLMTVTLKPGNVLYFPRGMIHQANTVPGKHSLHITLSCYQRNTWGHLLEKVLSIAVEEAMISDVELRRGLPPNYLDYMGVAHSNDDTHSNGDTQGNNTTRARKWFMGKVREVLGRVLTSLPVDAAADEMAKSFLEDALPPVLTPGEKGCSALHTRLKMGKRDTPAMMHFAGNSKIRLTRRNILRLVGQNQECHMYTCMNNSVKYHEHEQSSEVIPEDSVELLEELIANFPNYTRVADLPMSDNEEKVKFINHLWMNGLVLTEYPVGPVEDD